MSVKHRQLLAIGDVPDAYGSIHRSGRELCSIRTEGEEQDLELLNQAEDSLLVTLSNASQHLPRIFAAINGAGGNITETSLRSPNLETLFLLLTGTELRE